MKDIDDMDALGYLSVLSWRLNKDAGPRYIDEVGAFALTGGV